jgi:hypothetical protein
MFEHESSYRGVLTSEIISRGSSRSEVIFKNSILSFPIWQLSFCSRIILNSAVESLRNAVPTRCVQDPLGLFFSPAMPSAGELWR